MSKQEPFSVKGKEWPWHGELEMSESETDFYGKPWSGWDGGSWREWQDWVGHLGVEGNAYPVASSKCFYKMDRPSWSFSRNWRKQNSHTMSPQWGDSCCQNISRVSLFLQVNSASLRSIAVWEDLGFVFVLVLVQEEENFLRKFACRGVGGWEWGWGMGIARWKHDSGKNILVNVIFFLPHIELSSHIWKKYYFLLIKFCWTWLKVAIGWKCQLHFLLTQAIPSLTPPWTI